MQNKPNTQPVAHVGARRRMLVLLCCCVALCVAAGGTLAYIIAGSDAFINTFTPSAVDCEVSETFNENEKSAVTVTNTGDTAAYIRLKLVSNWVNADGAPVGRSTWTPNITPGDGWVLYNGYYYYTSPVEPCAATGPLFGGSIALSAEGDARQALDIFAEAVQADGAAVSQAWGVLISAGSVTGE